MKQLLLILALAAAGCATPPPAATDPLIAQLSSSARAAYGRGDLRKAGQFYEQALQAARARDDRAELPAIAANLAACRLAAGQTVGVAALLAEARRERRQAGQPTGDLDLLDASRLRAEGDVPGATATARQVAATSANPARVREAWQLVGLLAAKAGDAAGLADALNHLTQDRDALTELLRGEAHLQRVDPAGAGAQFDRAADAYRTAGRPAEMTEALARAGAAYRQANQPAAAADRLYRAARSAFARDDLVPALNYITDSLSALDAQDDPPTRIALKHLFDEIEKALAARPAP